ncbi:MAG: rhomboid family intramembrane serine protease [Galbitalea sp.]
MDTTGESTLSIVLSLVVLASGLQVAFRLRPLDRKFPIVALVLTVLIGIPSLLQFVFPQITDALSRRPALELDGQWWRVLTAVAAQDGGLAGAIFNLVVVAVVTTLGERAWGRWRMLVLFLAPSIILNLLAVAWNAPGGGSSFASDGLLLSMCALGVLQTRVLQTRRLLFVICTAIPVAAGIVLVVANDAHGVAMLVGAVLGLLFGLSRVNSRSAGARPG